MKKYKYIIFDFDGTINNTEKGIVYTFQKTLDHYSVDYSNVDWHRHIGPPLEFSFRELVGDAKWEEARELYRQIFVADNAVDMCQLYDGIVDVLQELRDRGYTLAIATSKYQPYAEMSVANLGIAQYFDVLYGQNEHRGYKDEILRQLIADHGWDKAQCLMIGDTSYDVNGAHANSIDILAVSYGFETRQALLECHPTYVVDSTKEILELL